MTLNHRPLPPSLLALVVGAILFALLVLASCSPAVRVARYYRHHANVQPRIKTVEEGRSYQGWSPHPAPCQQRPTYPTPEPRVPAAARRQLAQQP